MKIKDYAILIVEDEFIAREYLYQILYSLGVETIFKANNAKDAQEIVKSNQIDLAFMDINIKGSMDGIKCSALLNEEYFIPTIFATAYGDTNTINEAKEENIFGYLIKPFQASDVEATLNVAISSINRINKFKEAKKDELNYENNIDLGEKYIYYFESKTLTFKDSSITLTKKELDVLDILCKNINKNICYENIKDMVWLDKEISDTRVRDIISKLKKKIPHINIENISNFGYILKKKI